MNDHNEQRRFVPDPEQSDAPRDGVESTEKQRYNPEELSKIRALTERVVAVLDKMQGKIWHHDSKHLRDRIKACAKYLNHMDRVTMSDEESRKGALYTEKIDARISEFLDRSDMYVARIVIDQYERGTEKRADFFSQEDLEDKDAVKWDSVPTAPANMFAAQKDEYATTYFSQNFRRFGSVANLKRFIISSGDYSMLEGQQKEAAVMKDMKRATDLHLRTVRSVLRNFPQDPKLRARSATYGRTLERYERDMNEFVDLLVGVGDVSDANLYDPELAAEWGQEIVSGMSVTEGIAWARKMDKRIGYWQSAGQKSSGEGLFMGIAAGLRDSLERERREGNGGLRSEEAYKQNSMKLAELFRLQLSGENRGENMLAANKRDPRLHFVGRDHTFAVEMIKNAVGFEDLAFRYMALELRQADPLSATVEAGWPFVQNQIKTKLGSEGMQRLEGVAAYKNMVSKVLKTPQTISESVERYSIFLQLKSLADGSQVDQGAMQKDISEKYEPYMKKAATEFTTYLDGNVNKLLSGERGVGNVALTKSQIKALGYLSDMEGYGWDISDETAAYIEMGGKVVAMIGIGIGMAIATGGLSLSAQMAAVGLTMTASGAVMEGTAVDSFAEGVKVYGADLAVNSLGVGIGRVLGAGRYAEQLRNANPAGLGARQIFKEAMSKGGMARMGQYYDDAVGVGTRLFGATAEGVVDVTVSSWVDTQLVPGTTFIGNLQSNAMFMGLPFGMEFGRDVMRGLRLAPPQNLRNIHRLSGKITSEIETLRGLCGPDIDPASFYKSGDIDSLIASVDGLSLKDQVANSVGRLRSLETERVQVLSDMDRLVKNRLEVMERVGSLDESPEGRVARTQEGLDLLQFEGTPKDADGKTIDFKNPDEKYGTAILEAHDIGKPPYTPAELKQKREILVAVFDADQVDTLIRTRIAGIPPPPPPPPRNPNRGRIVSPESRRTSSEIIKAAQQMRDASSRPASVHHTPDPDHVRIEHGEYVWFTGGGGTNKLHCLARIVIHAKTGRPFISMPEGTIPLDDILRSRLAPVKNLHAEAVAALQPTAGWKLHLNFDPNDSAAVARVEAALNTLSQEGVIAQYKIGHGGGVASGQPGKEATVYIGDGRQAKLVSEYLEQELDGTLLPPTKYVLVDDMQINSVVAGRFDVAGDHTFHQYGSKGIPYHNKNIMDSLTANTETKAQFRKLADQELRLRYGMFYSGGLPTPAPRHIVNPTVTSASPVPSKAPSRRTVNPTTKTVFASTKRAPPPPPPKTARRVPPPPPPSKQQSSSSSTQKPGQVLKGPSLPPPKSTRRVPPPPPRRPKSSFSKPAVAKIAPKPKPSSSSIPRKVAASPSRTSAETRQSAAKGLALANTPSVKMPASLMQSLDTIRSQDCAVSVMAHMKNPNSARDTSPGYRTVSNKPGVLNRTGTSSGFYNTNLKSVTGEYDNYRNGREFGANNLESVFMRSEAKGIRQLVYYYQSDANLDTAGNRRGTALAIGIELPVAKAQVVYTQLKNHPEQTRAFFLAAAQDVDEADYIWRERTPPYAAGDSERKLVYVDEAHHSTIGKEARQVDQVLEIEYRTKDGGQWIESKLPDQVHTEAQKFQRQYLLRERNIETAKPLLAQIDSRLGSDKSVTDLLKMWRPLVENPNLCTAILAALDTPKGIFGGSKNRFKILLPVTGNDGAAKRIAAYLP